MNEEAVPNSKLVDDLQKQILELKGELKISKELGEEYLRKNRKIARTTELTERGFYDSTLF